MSQHVVVVKFPNGKRAVAMMARSEREAAQVASRLEEGLGQRLSDDPFQVGWDIQVLAGVTVVPSWNLPMLDWPACDNADSNDLDCDDVAYMHVTKGVAHGYYCRFHYRYLEGTGLLEANSARYATPLLD